MSAAFFASEIDTVANFWRIHRRDGAALAFTTHDRDLWFDGMLHRAAPGMLPSAIRKSAGFSDDRAEIEGALAHDSITESDLLAGCFDHARIMAGAVNWETLERAVLYRGTIGAITREAAGFTAALHSAKAALETDPIPRSSPTCRARFCGVGCGLAATRFVHRARLSAINPDANRVRFDALSSASFPFGELRWLDGPQTGQIFSILSASAEGLILDRSLAPGIVPGMRALLREGCDRTIATCASRFSNAVNFQGEAFLPGNDLLARYPMPR